MTIQSIIERQIREGLEKVFAIAKRVPADKLDWQPAPELRSVLSQLQEIATAPDSFRDAHEKRSIEFDGAKYAAWMEQRSALDTLEKLEAEARRNHEELYQFIRNLPIEALADPVKMPFPGEFDLARILYYYAWNLAYHEGQITAIAMQCGVEV